MPRHDRHELPKALRREINQTAHRLCQRQFERLRIDLLAEALEQFHAGFSVEEITRAVQRKQLVDSRVDQDVGS